MPPGYQYSLPQNARLVLGADLNCSESRRGGRPPPVLQPEPMIANSAWLLGFLKWGHALAANSEMFGTRHRHCATLALECQRPRKVEPDRGRWAQGANERIGHFKPVHNCKGYVMGGAFAIWPQNRARPCGLRGGWQRSRRWRGGASYYYSGDTIVRPVGYHIAVLHTAKLVNAWNFRPGKSRPRRSIKQARGSGWSFAIKHLLVWIPILFNAERLAFERV
jgi:hypothetical protein